MVWSPLAAVAMSAKRSCQEKYVNVDPTNTACVAALSDIHKVMEKLVDILHFLHLEIHDAFGSVDWRWTSIPHSLEGKNIIINFNFLLMLENLFYFDCIMTLFVWSVSCSVVTVIFYYIVTLYLF